MATQVILDRKPRVAQGDVIREVEFIEFVTEQAGTLEISKIIFPLVVVLTQDCDLEQDFRFRNEGQAGSHDKYLFSVLVAPVYNLDHMCAGEHLSELNMSMQSISRKKTPGSFLRNNEWPRYHFIEFPESTRLPPSVVDFKHYFSLNVQYARTAKQTRFACSLAPLFRDDLSHRFASYLSRIGLPE